MNEFGAGCTTVARSAVSDWTKSPAKVQERLAAIRLKLQACAPSTAPRQNVDPER